MKIRYIITAILLAASHLHAQPPHVASGTVKRFAQFPSAYIEPRNVDVWLPEGYSDTAKYAVLYMHDGQMLFDSATTWNKQEWGVDETLSRLMAEKKIKDCIVVGISNSAFRHSDYFPQKPFEALRKKDRDTVMNARRPNNQTVFSRPIQSDHYLKFLVAELKPFIDSAFSTLKDPKNTFIAGSSMGGLISMYAVCEYPTVFGGAACLSTHWLGIFQSSRNPVPPALMQYLKTHLPTPKNHNFYFDYGTATLDSLYKPLQKKADAVLKAKGYTAQNWITKEFVGENHSEVAWRKRLEIPILFLLKRK